MARRIDRLTRCPGPYRSCISASRLDGTKLAGNAAQKANRTLPQIEKILAEAPRPTLLKAPDNPQGRPPADAGPAGGAARAAGPGPDRLAAED